MASTIRGSDNFDSASKLTQGTAVASTSGTYIDFTGIPSTAKRITIMFSGVSTNGSSLVQIQIGSGSIDTGSTYYGCCHSTQAGSLYSDNFTTGFRIEQGSIVNSSSIRNGTYELDYLGSNIWTGFGNSGLSNTNIYTTSAGSKTLSGTLDRIRITTLNGTDTFDAGTINIMWEG
jgi:hypothetical protein